MTGPRDFWKRHRAGLERAAVTKIALGKGTAPNFATANFAALKFALLKFARNARGWSPALAAVALATTLGAPAVMARVLAMTASAAEVSSNTQLPPPRAVRLELNRTEALVRRELARLPADNGVTLIREPQRLILRIPARVLFPPDGVTLRSDHMTSLLVSLMAQTLQRRRRLSAEVVVYSDSIGGSSLNATLSGERAAAVRNALTAVGVAGARLQARGAGATGALASNDTPAGRIQNRRVDVTFERAPSGAGSPVKPARATARAGG